MTSEKEKCTQMHSNKPKFRLDFQDSENEAYPQHQHYPVLHPARDHADSPREFLGTFSTPLVAAASSNHGVYQQSPPPLPCRDAASLGNHNSTNEEHTAPNLEGVPLLPEMDDILPERGTTRLSRRKYCWDNNETAIFSPTENDIPSVTQILTPSPVRQRLERFRIRQQLVRMARCPEGPLVARDLERWQECLDDLFLLEHTGTTLPTQFGSTASERIARFLFL